MTCVLVARAENIRTAAENKKFVKLNFWSVKEKTIKNRG